MNKKEKKEKNTCEEIKKKESPLCDGDSLFDTASFLYSALAVERRQGQLDMMARLCETVERASDRAMSVAGRTEFERTGHIPVEVRFGQVPTGTGKSMAVILVALSSWLRWGLNSVVATHTHVLQDQMISKDFPFIKNRLAPLLGEEVLERWRSVLVKGMENYPCRLRMEMMHSSAMSAPGRTLLVHGKRSRNDVVVVMAGRIAELKDALRKKTFELSEDDPLFPLIRSDRASCRGEECPYMKVCPYITLMRIKSPFIVTNHAYLLSSVRSISQRPENDSFSEEDSEERPKNVSPFRNGDLYFFDEAHHLMGYRALGRPLCSVSLRDMEKLLCFAVPGDRLSLFKRERELRSRFLAAARKALVSGGDALDEMDGLLEEWRVSLEDTGGAYADSLRDARRIAVMSAGSIRALREMEESSKNSGGKLKKILSEDSVSLIEEGEANLLEDMKGALPSLRSVFCFSGTMFTKHSEQAECGEAFSAETGLVPTMSSFSAESPFSFEAVRIWVPENAPLGRKKTGGKAVFPWEEEKKKPYETREMREAVHDEFVDRFCCNYIPPYLEENLGGVLVLCSSKARMDRIAASLAEEVERMGMPRWLVMKQGERSKKNLARSFVKASQSAVLVGSSSFREGFDVRGRQLTWVVIDRLPFPVPGSEDMRRISELKKWGYIKDEFLHTVDILKFHLEQSVGRLVRTDKDWGTVTLLDNRVLTTGAGWKCERCFPVPMEKWYRDLPSRDEWIDMSYGLENDFRELLDSRKTEAAEPEREISGRMRALLAPNTDG